MEESERAQMEKTNAVDAGGAIAVFKGRQVRRVIHEDEWWFSVVDVVGALTDSANPRDYWFKMKIREKDEAGVELSTICRQLKLAAPDGKLREKLSHHAHLPGAPADGVKRPSDAEQVHQFVTPRDRP
jgi:hypothetical protein